MVSESFVTQSIALKNQDAAKGIDNSRIQFVTVCSRFCDRFQDEEIKANLYDPITKYLAQFREIKARLQVQETRKVDMDRYGRDMKSHQVHFPSGIAKLDRKKQIMPDSPSPRQNLK
jgi:hypothetical protein